MAVPLLAGLAGCTPASPQYNSAVSRRYDGPYCDGLVRFYRSNEGHSTRFSDTSVGLLSAYIGYNIRYASARQVDAVRRRLIGCAHYYDDLEREAGARPLTAFYERYRAGRQRAVIRRILASVPYRRPKPVYHAAAAPPPLPVPVEPPPAAPAAALAAAPIVKPPVHSKPKRQKAIAAPVVAAVKPPAGPDCQSAKTVASLRASYRTYYAQTIGHLTDYKTLTKPKEGAFTYCSAYATIPNDSHTIDYKFTVKPDGTVKVFPVQP